MGVLHTYSRWIKIMPRAILTCHFRYWKRCRPNEVGVVDSTLWWQTCLRSQLNVMEKVCHSCYHKAFSEASHCAMSWMLEMHMMQHGCQSSTSFELEIVYAHWISLSKKNMMLFLYLFSTYVMQYIWKQFHFRVEKSVPQQSRRGSVCYSWIDFKSTKWCHCCELK